MFGISWPELMVVMAVAVVVIGPRELPQTLYTLGKFVRKIKVFTADIQKSVDYIMHEAEMDEIIREANKAGDDNLNFRIEQQLAIEELRKKVEDKNQKDKTAA